MPLSILIPLLLIIASGVLFIVATCWPEKLRRRKPMTQAQLDRYMQDQLDKCAAENAKHCEQMRREQAQQAAEQIERLTANGGTP